MKKAFNKLSIGILGGGQLGKMLLQKAADFDLNIDILDPDENAPARYLSKNFSVGNLDDFMTVYQFGKKHDLLTIEIEHVNVDALAQLEKEGITVYPQPEVIRMVQDKGLQKLFYQKNDILSSDFVLIESKSEAASLNLSFPLIQKFRKGGYDGKGVVKVNTIEEIVDTPSVLEKLIDIKKEISVIVVRNSNGEVKSFPSVEMEFNKEANLVEFLFSPSSLSDQLEKEAEELAMKVASLSGITGILAVEMFLNQNDQLFVNEIAPRPHNSGHHTIEANVTSQYEQHLRAITGLPLGETSIIRYAVMGNILGEKNHSGEAIYEGIEEALRSANVYIHLYGKKTTRPFRKMGHFTVTADSVATAMKQAKQISKLIKVKSNNGK